MLLDHRLPPPEVDVGVEGHPGVPGTKEARVGLGGGVEDVHDVLAGLAEVPQHGAGGIGRRLGFDERERPAGEVVELDVEEEQRAVMPPIMLVGHPVRTGADVVSDARVSRP